MEVLKLSMKLGGDNKKKTVEVAINLLGASKNSLTQEEIRAGQEEGKLRCVKLLKERLSLPLMDCKRLAEEEFECLGLNFKSW